jgi:hypothetical protein
LYIEVTASSRPPYLEELKLPLFVSSNALGISSGGAETLSHEKRTMANNAGRKYLIRSVLGD